MKGWEEALEDAWGSRLGMSEGGGAVPFAEDGQLVACQLSFSDWEKIDSMLYTLDQRQGRLLLLLPTH